MNAVAMRSMVVGLAVGAVLTPCVISWLLRRGKLDVPNERSLHAAPVPRGAGIALIAATVVARLSAGVLHRAAWVVVLAAVALGAVGIIEDLRGISPSVRLALHGAIALAAALALDHRWVATPLTVFQIVAVFGGVTYLCNAVNFMDGINGISGAQAVAGGACLSIYGRFEHVTELQVGGLALVGAAVAFLPYNVPRAKVFLGDGGSYFIGAWLSLLIGVGYAGGLNPLVLLAPLVLYLADTSTTLLRRLLRHEALMQPHRDHTYQRLVAAGFSHVTVAAGLFALMVLQGATALLVRDASGAAQLGGLVLVVATTVAYLVLPTLLGNPTLRPSPSSPAATTHQG